MTQKKRTYLNGEGSLEGCLSVRTFVVDLHLSAAAAFVLAAVVVVDVPEKRFFFEITRSMQRHVRVVPVQRSHVRQDLGGLEPEGVLEKLDEKTHERRSTLDFRGILRGDSPNTTSRRRKVAAAARASAASQDNLQFYLKDTKET